MRKRLLASILAVAMMLTMAPFAFAADGDVAEIGEKGYSTLSEAVDAATAGQTVTLLQNTTVASEITINKNITIDLGQKTVTGPSGTWAFLTTTNSDVTIKNGSINAVRDGSAFNAHGKVLLEDVDISGVATDMSLIYVNNGANVTIDANSTVAATDNTSSAPYPAIFIGIQKGSADWAQALHIYGSVTAQKAPAIQGNGSDRSVSSVYIYDGATIETPKLAIYLPQPCEVNMTGGTVKGYCGIGIKSGTLNISGGTVQGVANDNDIGDQYSNTNGISYDGSAIMIDSYIGYAGQVEINISGDAKIESLHSTAIREIGNTASKTNMVALNVTGGQVLSGSKNGVQGNAITVRDVTKSTVTVTGGTFSTDVSEFVPSGCTITSNDGTWTIKDTRVVEIDGKGYATLAEAVTEAKNGDVIKLLKDIDLNEQLKISNGITIDGQNKYTIKATKLLSGSEGKGGMFYRTTSAQGTLTFLNVTLDGNNVSKIFINESGAGETIFDGVTSKNGGGIAYGSGIHISGGGSHATIKNSTLIDSVGTEKGNYWDANDLWVGGNVYVTVENSTIGEVFVNSAPTATATNNIVHGQLTIKGEKTKISYLSGEEENANHIDKFGNIGSQIKIENGKFETIYDKGVYSISGGIFSNEVKDEYLAPGYITEKTNGVYVVKSGTNDALALVDKAIESQKEEDITAAIEAVSSIPNSSLTDSTTMDKLAKLETAYTNVNTGIAVKVNDDNANIEVSDTATGAVLSAEPGETININVVDSTDTSVEDALKNVTEDETVDFAALDITMTKNEDTTPIQPKAPVVLTFNLPEGKDNAKIYRIENGTATAIPTTVNSTARTISGTFDHFSTYGVLYQAVAAGENLNEYEFILVPDKVDVSAGDQITYTVMLKHTEGKDTDTIGYFRVALTPEIGNNALLKFNNVSDMNTDVTFNTTRGAFEFISSNTGTQLKCDESMVVGKITYDVMGYDNTTIVNVAGSSTQLTNPKYPTKLVPTVKTSQEVTYHVTTVTFQQDNDTAKTYYVAYDGSDLYPTPDDLAAKTNKVTQVEPVLNMKTTGGTAYRLLDTEWHLSTSPDNADLYYKEGTTFKSSTTYVTKKVDLLEITIPENVVEVTTEVTEREGRKFVDKEADLTYKVKDSTTAGKKYKVTVKVNGNGATSVDNGDGTFTVKGTEVTASPVTFEYEEVLDLDASDIGIFTDIDPDTNVDAFIKYSLYSGTDTLVLIKGKENVNYTLGENQPTIYKTSAYEGYTHAVLVPIPETSQDVNEQVMLDYLVNTLKLQVTTTDNTVLEDIVKQWDTNGDGDVDEDFGDVQATNDFKTFKDGEMNWTPTDALLLMADVVNLVENGDKYTGSDYSAPRDGQVTDGDVAAFVYHYAHFGR